MERTKYRGIHRRKRQDGTVAYYLRCTVQGKRTWKLAGETISDARYMQKQLKQSKVLEDFGVKIQKRITFEKLADMYFEDYQKRRGIGNVARVRSIVKKLKGSFGKQAVARINEEEIDKQGFLREDLQYLRTILRKGKRWGYLNDVPEIKPPSRPKKLGRILESNELQKILEQASPEHRDAILLCLYMGGLRLGELTKIDQENTDFESGYVDITERKADQPKRFALVDQAASILRRRFLANGGVAFRESPGKLSQRFLYERRKMKGIKPWRFHDLRHTITEILEGENIETLREILGHSDIKTTVNYMHANIDKQRKVLLRVQDYVSR